MMDAATPVDRAGLRNTGISILWHAVKILAVAASSVVVLDAAAGHHVVFPALVPAIVILAVAALTPGRGAAGALPRALARRPRL
jgi:hypothetical protein